MFTNALLRLVRNNNAMRYVQRSRLSYSFSSEQKDFGVKFDEDQIKNKMEQIKNRKTAKNNANDLKIDFMRVNRNSEIDRKVKAFRQSTDTQNLLQFSDPSL